MRLTLNHTCAPEFMMPDPLQQPSAAGGADLRLSEVSIDEVVELVRFEMPDDQIEPLLERGVLPGCRICPVRRSPSGDPIVEIDGVMLALRRETAGCLCVKRAALGAD